MEALGMLEVVVSEEDILVMCLGLESRENRAKMLRVF